MIDNYLRSVIADKENELVVLHDKLKALPIHEHGLSESELEVTQCSVGFIEFLRGEGYELG